MWPANYQHICICMYVHKYIMYVHIMQYLSSHAYMYECNVHTHLYNTCM